jgi:hypothetical protein
VVQPQRAAQCALLGGFSHRVRAAGRLLAAAVTECSDDRVEVDVPSRLVDAAQHRVVGDEKRLDAAFVVVDPFL